MPTLTCAGCGQPVVLDTESDPHAADRPEPVYVDPSGDVCCEIRYDDCSACQDGESHPHWVAGLTRENIHTRDEERAARAAIYKQSREAVTYDDHIDAARALLTLVKPNGMYNITPVSVSVAQVHATLAVALADAPVDLRDVGQEIDELTRQVSSLETDVATLTSDVTELQQRADDEEM